MESQRNEWAEHNTEEVRTAIIAIVFQNALEICWQY